MDKTIQFWNKQAEKYDQSEQQFNAAFEDILALTKKHLKPTDNILDFGCATATKTLRLAESVNHIEGLDISAEMIKAAIIKADKQNIDNIDFSVGSIFENEYQKEQFDVVVSYGVLHLLEDIDKSLQSIHNLIKPGGLFIASSACMKDKMDFKNRIKFLMFMIIKVLKLFPLHLNLWKCEDIEQATANNGFNIIEKKRIFNGISISYIVAQK
jgi:ubiquinone/menaquinone biosynthesis C-methylase UbiE